MKKRIGIFVMVALLTVALAGCRPSPAVVELEHTMDAPVDQYDDNQYIDNSEENTQKNDDLSPEQIDDSSTDPRERQRQDPVSGDTGQDGTAPDVTWNSQSSSDRTVGGTGDQGQSAATEDGTSSDGSNTASDGTGGSGNGTGDGSGASSTGSGNGTSGNGTGDGSGSPGAGEATGTRQIVDASGRNVDLPEDVATVAAPGEAALIVEMLGGSGRLAGSSESFASGFAKTVFADESIDEVDTLWDGYGTSPMSDADFQTLLQEKPQAVIEISGQENFSDDQLKQLEENQISYVVIPSLNTYSGICSAVQMVGDVLGTYGGVDAPANADRYQSFCDEVIEKASEGGMFSPDGINYDTGKSDSSFSQEDGGYALFLSGWDSSASWSLHDDTTVELEGQGLPVAVTGYTSSPVSYLMSVAGAANTAALKENCYSVTEPSNRYVSPVNSANEILSVQGGYGKYDKKYVMTTAGGYYLGEKEFKDVIVANEDIKTGIENSSLWENYGYQPSKSGLTGGYGFRNSKGVIVETTIRDDYNIHVNPQGAGSWTAGSAESVLEALWVADVIGGRVSDSELRSTVKSFYSEFYRHDLTDEQLNQILGSD
ncbi:MAG: hypothetical protein ACOYJI_02490 [Anaerovoracaceae bacterium]